ncbi:hypothetical protein BKA93DRAFT_826264 [Sparassis latifolia]
MLGPDYFPLPRLNYLHAAHDQHHAIGTYPIWKRADTSSYNVLNPYAINNTAGALSNGTSYTNVVHSNGLTEYDTHNMFGAIVSNAIHLLTWRGIAPLPSLMLSPDLKVCSTEASTEYATEEAGVYADVLGVDVPPSGIPTIPEA